MLQRIATCLCHPKKIGMFFKDKYNYVIGFILGAFALLAGVGAITYFNTDFLTYEDVRGVTSAISRVEEEDVNLVFDADTMTLKGEGRACVSNGVAVYFLRTSSLALGSSMTYDFKAEYVDIYYQYYYLGSVKYSEFSFDNDITVYGINNGNIAEKNLFEEFVYAIDNRMQTSVSNVNYAYFLVGAIIDYIVVVIVAMIGTCMFNPTIDFKMRLKLVLMATLVYFLLMIFYIMFMQAWIKYIALVVPVIYSTIALAHIRKVSK